MRVSAAHGPRRGSGNPERLIHDAPNGARAAPALRAATQAMVNLPRGARHVLARRQRGTHVVVGENVARAHDHCGESPKDNWSELKPSIVQARRGCKEKIVICKRSNLRELFARKLTEFAPPRLMCIKRLQIQPRKGVSRVWIKPLERCRNDRSNQPIIPARRSSRGRRVFRTLAAAAARPQPANARRYPAQVLDQTGKTLPACQRPVERCHGACEPRIVIVDPGAQHAAE